MQRRERPAHGDAVGDAAPVLQWLDLVLEPDAAPGQPELGDESRIRLDLDQPERRRRHAGWLRLALRADLERTVEARPLDPVTRPLGPMLDVDVPPPDR